MEIEERIDQFVEHFERQIMLVSSITSDPRIVVGTSDPAIRVALHKKILYSAIIDALAAIRFMGEGLNNTKRFTSILRLHSGWTACELVSVPMVAERLQDLASPAYGFKIGKSYVFTTRQICQKSIERLLVPILIQATYWWPRK